MNKFIDLMVGEGAVVSGKVSYGKDCSIWYNATVRGDTDELNLGNRVNIQESAVLHVDEGYPINIGDDVTIGHGAIVHGARIENNCMIGMGSILMDGCIIRQNTLVAAGSLVPQNKEFPQGVLLMGNPAKVIRELTEEEIAANQNAAAHYVESAKKHFGYLAASKDEKEESELNFGKYPEGKSLEKLLEGCRTYRRFAQESIPREDIEAIVSMASKRSCGKNAQELRFVAITGREKIKKLGEHMKWAAALPPEIGTPKENEMPTALIAIYYAGAPSMIRDIDTGIAADTIAIAGADRGYGSCIMASIDAKAIKSELGLDENTTMRLVIAMGKPTHRSEIVEGETGGLSYYVDEERNYFVPKLAIEKVLSFNDDDGAE